MRGPSVMIAALVAACAAQAQVAEREPACRAEHSGEEIVTRVVFSDGYTIEGPWHVTGITSVGQGTSITAVLEHIVETRPRAESARKTALPGAIRMTFSGRTMGDLLSEAAHVWCATVLHARPSAPKRSFDEDAPSPYRIM